LQENDIAFTAAFESFVRGEQTFKSHIEIAIELDKNSRKTLLDLVGTEEDLTKIFGRKVDWEFLAT